MAFITYLIPTYCHSYVDCCIIYYDNAFNRRQCFSFLISLVIHIIAIGEFIIIKCQYNYQYMQIYIKGHYDLLQVSPTRAHCIVRLQCAQASWVTRSLLCAEKSRL